MSNANYVKGRRSEYEHAAHLEDNGYTLVMRAAGSHGVADLIMAKQGELLFVQCKQTAHDSPAKRAELRGLAALVGAVPLLAGWEPNGPRGGKRPCYVDISRELAPRVWTPDHGLEAAG
jgi:hypothetical protein